MCEQGSRSGLAHNAQRDDLSLSLLSWRPADPFGDVFCWFGDLARIIGSEKVSDGFLSGREPP